MSVRASDVSTIALAIAAFTLGIRSLVSRNDDESASARRLAVDATPIPQWARVASTGQWLGSERAPLKIVEFADFTCIHCAEQHEILLQFRAEFPDQAAVVFKHFPLGTPGYELALAAECVSETGQFSVFHDAAFRLRKSGITAARWWQVTRQAGIADSSRIAACVLQRTGSSEVETDVTDGRRLALSGTPAMLLNGVLHKGVVPIEALRRAIVEQRTAQFPVPKDFR
jgi:protein-disulfide isomerase